MQRLRVLKPHFRIQFAAPGLRQLTDFNQSTTTMSAFLQTYVDITDRFRIQGGVRFTHEKTDMGHGVWERPAGADPTAGPPTPGRQGCGCGR